MPLTLRRKRDETWLEAALRISEAKGLRTEVEAEYDAAMALHATMAQSAWAALYTWDLLPFETPGRGGWPIFDGALRCPVCLSADITFAGSYAGVGTGPGGRGRLGDPGGLEINQCGECGETHTWAAQTPDGVRW